VSPKRKRPEDKAPAAPSEARWLLLLHQLPPKPAYLRVKTWRRLQGVGAVSIKNSVYALPKSEQAMEDFEWIAREIAEAGGEVAVGETRFAYGMSDTQIEALFGAARDADYTKLADEIRGVLKRTRRRSARTRGERDADLRRLRARLEEIGRIDFFHSSGGEAARALLAELEARLAPPEGKPVAEPESVDRGAYVGRTWVTRKGIHVDRMASAWLIRRFIDPGARFKFVSPRGYQPEPGELRFDMIEAEFTHVGDRCTFEVLCDRMRLEDRALGPIAEIIHDIDIKDGKFGRRETGGVEALVNGIAATSGDDDERLARGSAVFQDLHEHFKRRR
jgi:hypothetical protein